MQTLLAIPGLGAPQKRNPHETTHFQLLSAINQLGLMYRTLSGKRINNTV